MNPPPSSASFIGRLTYLFRLQAVSPDSFQEVTQAGNQRIIFHARYGNLSVTQLQRLAAHLADEQTFRFRFAFLLYKMMSAGFYLKKKEQQ